MVVLIFELLCVNMLILSTRVYNYLIAIVIGIHAGSIPFFGKKMDTSLFLYRMVVIRD